MRVLRKRLAFVLAAAVVLQCVGFAAPLVLSAAGFDVTEMCTCPSGSDGATCPMHHGKGTESQHDANRCTLKSAAASSDLALLTMMSGAGNPPSIVTLHITAQTSEISSLGTATVSTQAVPPDAPPPRR
jgi:hypothetical protein